MVASSYLMKLSFSASITIELFASSIIAAVVEPKVPAPVAVLSLGKAAPFLDRLGHTLA
jgi:hypothetical protein